MSKNLTFQQRKWLNQRAEILYVFYEKVNPGKKSVEDLWRLVTKYSLDLLLDAKKTSEGKKLTLDEKRRRHQLIKDRNFKVLTEKLEKKYGQDPEKVWRKSERDVRLTAQATVSTTADKQEAQQEGTNNTSETENKEAEIQKTTSESILAQLENLSLKTLHLQHELPFAKLTNAEKSEQSSPLFLFGIGDCGQLGMGDDILSTPRNGNMLPLTSFTPVSPVKVQRVVCGSMHTIIVLAKEIRIKTSSSSQNDSASRLYSWGCNDDGALGRDTSLIPESQPGPIHLPHDSSTSETKTTLENESKLFVTCGDSHACCLNESTGSILTWGTYRDGNGILGRSTSSRRQQKQQVKHCTPTKRWQPRCLTVPEKNGASAKFVQIASGDNHCIALTSDNAVYTWGAGHVGQLGRRVVSRFKTNAALNPRRIKIIRGRGCKGVPKGKKIVKIGAGAFTSFAVVREVFTHPSTEEESTSLTANNSLSTNASSSSTTIDIVYGWGLDNYGQLGKSPPNEIDFINEKNPDSPLKCTTNLGQVSMFTYIPQRCYGWSLPSTTNQTYQSCKVLEIQGGMHHTVMLLELQPRSTNGLVERLALFGGRNDDEQCLPWSWLKTKGNEDISSESHTSENTSSLLEPPVVIRKLSPDVLRKQNKDAKNDGSNSLITNIYAGSCASGIKWHNEDRKENGFTFWGQAFLDQTLKSKAETVTFHNLCPTMNIHDVGFGASHLVVGTHEIANDHAS
eukprot:g185.t1